MSTIETVLTGLESSLGWLHTTYKQLHSRPELAFAEHQTAQLVAEQLTSFGYEVQSMGGTGVVGVLTNGQGATVMARADMDALPVAEATGLPYASEVSGVMHACGHDVHVAALLGAARLMAKAQESWQGTYIALFQPAEELGGGAQAMLDDGLLAKVPRPDVVLGQHVMPLPAGSVATAAGPVLSAADSLKITVYGKGSHGSMPHMSVDPVVLAAAIVLKLQTIVARETPPGEFAVITVGSVQAGTTANIIPDQATLLLNMRSHDSALRVRLLAAIERIVRGECAAAGSPREPEFTFYEQFPLTNNDGPTTHKVTTAFTAHFGQEHVQAAARQPASEDFSHIPEAFGVPYTYWFLGGCDPLTYHEATSRGTVLADIPANHSPAFAPVMDPTLSMGVQAQVAAALAFLEPPGA